MRAPAPSGGARTNRVGHEQGLGCLCVGARQTLRSLSVPDDTPSMQTKNRRLMTAARDRLDCQDETRYVPLAVVAIEGMEMKEEPDATTGPLRDVACPRLAALLADGTGGARGFERGVVVVGAGWIPCQPSSLLGEQRVRRFSGWLCRWGRWRPCGFESWWVLRWLLPVWPAAWAGSALAGRLVFPITLGHLWLIPLAGSVVMGAGPHFRSARPRAVVQGLAAWAWASVRPQSPRDSSGPSTRHHLDTRPSQSNLVEHTPVEGTKPTLNTGTIRLGFDTVVHTSDGSLTVRFSPLSISVQPLLTFLNGSDDGCWSVLVRSQDRVGPEPRLRGSQLEGERGCTLFYDFRGQGPATLRVQA